MYENYTLAANARCFDLIDPDLFAVWEEIENTQENTSAEIWRGKLTRLAAQYALSSRFALMRILCARTFGCSPSESEQRPGFTIRLSGQQSYTFEALGCYRERTELLELLERIAAGEAAREPGLLDELCVYERQDAFRPQINPDGGEFKPRLYAMTGTDRGVEEIRALARAAADRLSGLLEEEHGRYLEVLLDIASRQADADWPDVMALCCRAMRASGRLGEFYASRMDGVPTRRALSQARRQAERDCSQMLTREEALRLGHFLAFSLQEMSWFLLRVFDHEDGFRYHSSRDLIEAYGFLTGAGWREVCRWQACYRQRTQGIAKAEGEGRTLDWTQSVQTSLPLLVERWSETPEEREERFLDWLLRQAPYLDLPSRTATGVYRALAVWADRLIAQEAAPESGSALLDELDSLCHSSAGREAEVERALFDGGAVSAQKCGELSRRLMKENKEQFTFEPDLAKAWRTITTDRKGQLRLTVGGGPGHMRNRIQELLLGTLQVEKGDLLYLLWFLFSLYWLVHPIATRSDLYNNLADYCDAAQMVLDGAGLSGFYPPHILEQSMMLSIVLSSQDTGNPADIYAEVCSSLVRPRKTRASAGRP